MLFRFYIFSSFIRLPTNKKIHNGVKIGGKICFGEDIDVFIRMHKLINNTEYIYCLQNSINNEVKWFSHNR